MSKIDWGARFRDYLASGEIDPDLGRTLTYTEFLERESHSIKTGESALTLLVEMHQASPFEGSLGDALSRYIDVVGRSHAADIEESKVVGARDGARLALTEARTENAATGKTIPKAVEAAVPAAQAKVEEVAGQAAALRAAIPRVQKVVEEALHEAQGELAARWAGQLEEAQAAFGVAIEQASAACHDAAQALALRAALSGGKAARALAPLPAPRHAGVPTPFEVLQTLAGYRFLAEAPPKEEQAEDLPTWDEARREADMVSAMFGR